MTSPSPLVLAKLQQAYALTRKGEEELNGAATTMSTQQLQLLICLDGRLTLEQIKSLMPEVTTEAFLGFFHDLLERGLVVQVHVDSFGTALDTQVSRFIVPAGSRGETAGMQSLRRSGYYVELARGREQQPQLTPNRPLTALVVEDEPTLSKFIKTYLVLEGFEVRLAGTRAEVIQALNQRPLPDLVLLDVGLPDVDGFDILVKLRQHPQLKHIPAIMLTGKSTREAVIRGIQCGADGYVTKPFQPDALMRAVRTVLGLAADAQADPWVNGDAAITRKWQSEPGATA